MTRPSRTALILSGAFAFGAYQVGVMLALLGGRCRHLDGPLRLDAVTGTSIGALNAALLLSAADGDWYRAAEYVKDVYLDDLASTACGGGAVRLRGNPADLFRAECYATGRRSPVTTFVEDVSLIADDLLQRSADFLRSSAAIEQRLLRFVDLSIFASTRRFAELIRRRVDPSRLRTSSTSVQLLATNWRTGELQVFDPHALDESVVPSAIQASAAVPGLVPPVEIAGEPYVDGGLVMNTGLGPAIDAGADELHVVYMDTTVSNMPIRPFAGTADTIYRMLAINLASMLNRDIAIAERVNAALGAPSSAAAGGAPDRLAPALAQTAGRQYRPLTIHRYRAATNLGGAAGWLSFDLHNVVNLIERGYRETVAHDCVACGCSVPPGAARA